jgi:hypothetical protein
MAPNPDHNGESRLPMRVLALLHMAKKELCLDDEDYRDLLERTTGARSARDVVPDALMALQRELRRLGWNGYLLRRDEVPPLEFEDLGNRRPGFPNPKQLRMLKAMFLNTKGFGDIAPDYAFRKFLEKRFRVSDARMLDANAYEAALAAVRRLQRARGVKREYRK